MNDDSEEVFEVFDSVLSTVWDITKFLMQLGGWSFILGVIYASLNR